MAAFTVGEVSIAANGDIRWTGAAQTHTVLEFDELVQSLADDAVAVGNDLIDITAENPSNKSTDQIIELIDHSATGGPTYNIDDEFAEHLFDGSVLQRGGDELYSGLEVLGAVNDTNTQLMVIQDNDLYQFTTTPAAPFWGDQATGGFNGNAAAGLLMRCLIKTRTNGADINGKRVRIQARHWGDTYDFFNVTMGEGVSVAAIGTTPDPQNDTLQATVTAYTHVVNSGGTSAAPTGGYQTIDLNNGNGAQPYYSGWTFGADTSGDGLKGIWEYIKDLSGNGTARTIDSINGELFLGVTHQFDYDGEVGGPFTERETIAWGTRFAYDTEATGPFTLGEFVTIGASGAAGKLVDLEDLGTSGNMVIALEDTSITLLDNDVITGLTSGATAAINGAITDNAASGGTGLLLADDGTDTMWMQLLTGSPPVDNLRVIGNTSSATALVNGSITLRTVPKIFLGSYTGSLIGAFGIGIDSGDLSATDTITDLLNVTQTPPNNVTFTVTGLVSGEDRVLVGPRAGGILQKDQFGVATSALVAGSTSIIQDAPIPTDTPSSGDVRVQDDNGIYIEVPYASYTGSTWTLSGTYGSDAAIANNIFVAYIDELAGAASASVTLVYLANRDVQVRVRDGGTTPIDPFEAPSQITASGGTIAAIRNAR